MAVLGTMTAVTWAAVGGSSAKKAQGPPINASSSDEEKFIKYGWTDGRGADYLNGNFANFLKGLLEECRRRREEQCSTLNDHRLRESWKDMNRQIQAGNGKTASSLTTWHTACVNIDLMQIQSTLEVDFPQFNNLCDAHSRDKVRIVQVIMLLLCERQTL